MAASQSFPPPDQDSQWASRYGRAGLVYFVLGTAIMGVTVASPELASAERRADIIHLLVGLPFFALFAAFIAWGDRLVGRVWQERGTMLLAISALGRTGVFLGNALGWKPRLRPTLHLEAIEPVARMWGNFVLMGVILGVLVWASWWPFLRRSKS